MSRWILTVIAGVLLIAPAFAQNQPLACQADEAAGLNWKNGRWEVTSFTPKPAKFILVQTGDSLTPESVGKVFIESEIPEKLMPSCRRAGVDDHVVCTDGWGSGLSLIFSFRTMTGSHAAILGSISANQKQRDSVSVTTFTCQPF